MLEGITGPLFLPGRTKFISLVVKPNFLFFYPLIKFFKWSKFTTMPHLLCQCQDTWKQSFVYHRFCYPIICPESTSHAPYQWIVFLNGLVGWIFHICIPNIESTVFLIAFPALSILEVLRILVPNRIFEQSKAVGISLLFCI